MCVALFLYFICVTLSHLPCVNAVVCERAFFSCDTLIKTEQSQEPLTSVQTDVASVVHHGKFELTLWFFWCHRVEEENRNRTRVSWPHMTVHRGSNWLIQTESTTVQFVQTFMVSRGWYLANLAILLWCHHDVEIFAIYLKMLTMNCREIGCRLLIFADVIVPEDIEVLKESRLD